MKIEKFVLPIETQTKKEAIKMIKKCLAVTLAALIVIFNVLPAQAYTEISTPVYITATGTLSGSLVSMTAVVVAQATGGSLAQVDFISPSGVSDSADAIKISGGTNDLDARIIVYTDNQATYWPSRATVKTNDPYWGADGKRTGMDGAGMPGATSAGYVAALFWGMNSGADFAPQTNTDYVFDGNLNDGIGEVYMVDKGHTHSIITQATVDAVNARLGTSYTIATLDALPLYDGIGASVANTANEGSVNTTYPSGTPLIPQQWNQDLYNSATVRNATTLVSEALYKNIATVAYSIRTPDPLLSDETGYYICNTPKLTTALGSDSVRARLAKTSAASDQYLYVYIGGNFSGLPAQAYTTTKLYVAMIKG